MLALLEAPESGPAAFADGELEAVFASRFRQFVTEPTARDAYGRLFAGLGISTAIALVILAAGGLLGWLNAIARNEAHTLLRKASPPQPAPGARL